MKEEEYLTGKQNLKAILLADDDEDDVLLFKEVLGSNYEEIKVVNNGFEAIASLKELPIADIIFLDVNMPLMDGVECLKRIRNLSETIPIIILTTSDNETLIKQVKALGASGFISKPFTFSRYKDVIKDVMSIDWAKSNPSFYLSIK